MKKYYLLLILALILSLGFVVACGDDDDDDETYSPPHFEEDDDDDDYDLEEACQKVEDLLLECKPYPFENSQNWKSICINDKFYAFWIPFHCYTEMDEEDLEDPVNCFAFQDCILNFWDEGTGNDHIE